MKVELFVRSIVILKPDDKVVVLQMFLNHAKNKAAAMNYGHEDRSLYASGGPLPSASWEDTQRSRNQAQRSNVNSSLGNIVGGAAAVAPMVAQLGASSDPKKPNSGATIGSTALSGAAIGTSILPGWGTAIGAVVGAGAGVIMAGSQKRKYNRLMQSANIQKDRLYTEHNQNRFMNDVREIFGDTEVKSLYAHGGKLPGGGADALSKDAVSITGNRHEQGGVKLSGTSEVEGGETIQNGFVFSDRLGFADEHRKLAKRIGRLEMKPKTPSRVNTLKHLGNRVEALAHMQESIKQA